MSSVSKMIIEDCIEAYWVFFTFEDEIINQKQLSLKLWGVQLSHDSYMACLSIVCKVGRYSEWYICSLLPPPLGEKGRQEQLLVSEGLTTCIFISSISTSIGTCRGSTSHA